MDTSDPLSDIASSSGPQLLGALLNWCLLGVLIVQVYIFYLCFPNDRASVKCLVYILFLLEWIQTALMTVDIFRWFVYSWGQPDINILLNVNTSWFNVPILDGVISAIVQIFFSWQIWTISHSFWVPGIIIIIALAQASTAMITGIKLQALGTFRKIGVLFPYVITWHVGEVTADFIIAATMTYLLLRKRRGFPKTDYLVGRVIRLFVETGTVTSTTAIVDLVLFLVFKKNNLHTCPATILPKLYTNTLLAVLNNRVFTARSEQAKNRSVQSYFNARSFNNQDENSLGSQAQPNIHIAITTDVVLDEISVHNKNDDAIRSDSDSRY